MPVEVDDELEKYAAKPDDELEKYAAKPVAAPTTPHGPLQGLEHWYTAPTQTEIPSNVPGVTQEPEGVTNSPQQTVHRGAAIGSVIGAPALVGSAIAAPLATGLGLAGSAVGGYGGSKLGGYLGEKVGAPELGGDVGGLTGSFFGGMAGASSPKPLRSIGRSILLDPVTGKPTLSPSTIAERVLREPPAPFEEKGAPLPTASEFYEKRGADLMKRAEPKQVDPLVQAVREGRAAKIPTRIPVAEEPPAPRTSPFGEATSSATPQGNAQLPAIGSQVGTTPPVSFVSKLERPAVEPVGRIIRPGTPEAEPPHVEGSYWSFQEAALRKAVMSGDRDAAIVYKQRFGQLPEGASFLTDVGAKPNRGLYRSER
jgi:hypothetical protein